MSNLEKLFSNRRAFLTTAVRSLTLLGFAAFAAGQEVKRRRLANDPNCIRLSTCPECIEFGRCQKPKAQEARQSPPGRERTPA